MVSKTNTTTVNPEVVGNKSEIVGNPELANIKTDAVTVKLKNTGNSEPVRSKSDARTVKPEVTSNTGAVGGTSDTVNPVVGDAPPGVQTTLQHDMIVVQFHSVLIQPHADNPLPRYPVEKELYHQALVCGMTHQPGTAVEDRQYQIDVRGFSLSSGLSVGLDHIVTFY